jgi:hypothetical protein
MRKWLIAAVALALAFSGVAIGYYLNPVGVPPVKGYMEGKEIRFIHTEASDAKVAELLTDMMGSPVLVVPALAQAPNATLSNVYVFTNGIRGEGPLGFQPDVFDNPPGTAGYSPLRALNLVTWKRLESARELKSAAEVKRAVNRAEVTSERPGVIINMPLLTWPGGRR